MSIEEGDRAHCADVGSLDNRCKNDVRDIHRCGSPTARVRLTGEIATIPNANKQKGGGRRRNGGQDKTRRQDKTREGVSKHDALSIFFFALFLGFKSLQNS